MNSEAIIGPNPCPECSGEYGDHYEDCSRHHLADLQAPARDTEIAEANQKLLHEIHANAAHREEIAQLTQRLAAQEKELKAMRGALRKAYKAIRWKEFGGAVLHPMPVFDEACKWSNEADEAITKALTTTQTEAGEGMGKET